MFFKPIFLLSTCINTKFFLPETRAYTNNIGNFLLFNCYFTRINRFHGNDLNNPMTDPNNPRGGILMIYFIDSTFVNLTVNECVFNNVSSKGSGGCFAYDVSGNGHCNFKKNCGTYCTSNGWSNFGSFLIPFDNSHFHNFDQNTLYKCSYIPGNGIASITISYGIQSITNLNCTNNEAQLYSSIIYDQPYQLNCQYSNFYSNKCSDYVSFLLSGSKFHLIKYNNIIKNNNNNINYGVIWLNNANFTFDNCIFQNNNGTLFHCFGISLTIINSKIYHINNLLYNGTITLSNNLNILDNTFQITSFFTNNCINLFENKTKNNFIYLNKFIIFFELILNF